MTKGEMKVGELDIPDGLILIIPVILVHYDKEIWGEDPKEFKLEIFSEGVSKATKEQFSYIPFGGGPRICIGQNIAMMEAEMATAMILQKFSFELSILCTCSICNNDYSSSFVDVLYVNFDLSICRNKVKQTSKSSFVWLGPYPVLLITNPEHVKEILTRNYVYLKQTHPNPLTKLLAQGTMAATNLDATFDCITDNIEDIKWHVERLRQLVSTLIPTNSKSKVQTPCDESLPKEVAAQT
ncbi:putative secologanin synthase-like [Capsicum annuum]|nr:putative secologanin synthase-like [Capsicum annuum]